VKPILSHISYEESKNYDHTIKSFRPISLLNFDYKLFTRVLKFRIDGLLPLVVDGTQAACNRKKNISSALCHIRDKLAEMRFRRKNGVMVSFDLDHAFDRVSHRFLLEILRKLKFNNNFIELLKKIMENSYSIILINGRLSPEIKICSSVRQGDPLSMTLFVIYINTILQKLTQICNGPNDLVKAYADDITVITDNEDKIERVKAVFDNFERVSAAKVNYNKTLSLTIGNFQHPQWSNQTTELKILGIYFQQNLHQAATRNWDETFNKVRHLLFCHQNRDLNIIQRVILCNVFALSKIWFLAAIFPTTNQMKARVTSSVGMFIWRGHPLRVAFNNLILPVKMGGLALMSPAIKTKTIFITNFLNHSSHNPFISQFISLQNPPYLPSFPAIPYIKNAIHELSYIPLDQIQTPLRSKSLYCFFLSHYRTCSPRNDPINWKAVWTNNVSSKQIPSQTRAHWYLMAHNKLPLREKLFQQNRVASPNCFECVQVEDLYHKYVTSIHSRQIWARTQTYITANTGKLLHFGQLAKPDLSNTTASVRRSAIKYFAIFLNYIEQVQPQNRNIESILYNLENEIFFCFFFVNIYFHKFVI
jgi:Reverse transcriptase (RNA-dependent DNA polymerase)/zinc-binding in reverse transcriptase